MFQKNSRSFYGTLGDWTSLKTRTTSTATISLSKFLSYNLWSKRLLAIVEKSKNTAFRAREFGIMRSELEIKGEGQRNRAYQRSDFTRSKKGRFEIFQKFR